MNVWSADQKFVSEKSVVEADEPVPEIQLPLTAKHPEVRLIPFANVELAVVLVTFNRLTETPPANVDVAVEVATNLFATTVPPTESFSDGEEVPIPTFPVVVESTNPLKPLKTPLSLNCI